MDLLSNRRKWLKRGALFVPSIFIPRLILAQQISPGPIIRTIGSASGPTLVFTDTFNRADADPMSTTASGGGTWTSGEGSFDDCVIVSNTLGGKGVSGARVLTTNSGGSFNNDQACYGTFAAAGVKEDKGVMTRITSTTIGAGYLAFADDSTHVQIYIVADAGSIVATPLGAAFTVTALVAGDILGLSSVGTTHTAYINGVSIGSRTDATLSSGSIGVYFSGITSFFDQITGYNT